MKLVVFCSIVLCIGLLNVEAKAFWGWGPNVSDGQVAAGLATLAALGVVSYMTVKIVNKKIKNGESLPLEAKQAAELVFRPAPGGLLKITWLRNRPLVIILSRRVVRKEAEILGRLHDLEGMAHTAVCLQEKLSRGTITEGVFLKQVEGLGKQIKDFLAIFSSLTSTAQSLIQEAFELAFPQVEPAGLALLRLVALSDREQETFLKQQIGELMSARALLAQVIALHRVLFDSLSQNAKRAYYSVYPESEKACQIAVA